MRKYGRTDGNQADIVRHLNEVPGVKAVSIASMGNGYPDLIIGYQGRNYLVELKDPSKPPCQRRLTKDEQAWHDSWPGQVEVCETVLDILQIIGAEIPL